MGASGRVDASAMIENIRSELLISGVKLLCTLPYEEVKSLLEGAGQEEFIELPILTQGLGGQDLTVEAAEPVRYSIRAGYVIAYNDVWHARVT